MKPLQRNKMAMANGDYDSKNGHQTEVLERPPAARVRPTGKQQDADGAMTDADRLLEAILNNIPDRIYFKDSQSRFIKVSKSVAPRLGVEDPALVIGKTDFDFNPTKKAQEYFQDDQRIMQSGQPLLNKVERHILPNGEISWTSTTKAPLRNREGKIIGLIGINRDITDLTRAEQALRESYEDLEEKVDERAAEISRERELLRTLVDNLPDIVYAKDTKGRKILSNPADVGIAHRKTETEVIGKTDFDLFPKDIAEKFHADDQKVMQGEAVINREEYFRDETGRKRWLLTSKLPLRDQKKRIVGLVGIGREITDRKQAEEALAQERSLLRTLIDNLPDLVYAKDAAGRKVLANPADLKTCRCQTEADIIGKSDFDLFPKDIAVKFWADDQKVIQGQSVINREEYFLDEAGRKRWLLTSKLPLRDTDKKVIGLVGIGRDITERRQAEEALRTSEAKLRKFTTQLERSNRELQDFAYVASHDLQEPLRKIVVFGERLKEQSEQLSAESRDYLERMQKAASRMQTLINDLLSFSRVTTKARPFTQVDLAEVAREVINDLEGRIELVKGRVEMGTLPLIEAEPLQMRQLFQNLIGNALKFRRPEAPPVVKVTAQIITVPAPEGAAGATKKLCQLTVSDNGIGFDEKYLDRIFNVFQRLHSRSEYEGTGMGLAITRKIALFHRGDITAKSKPGEGATFIVTLPMTQPKEPQNPGENHE